MNVVVYRRGAHGRPAPRLVCAQPVFEQGRGRDRQLAHRGGRSIVVENNYGYTGPAATAGRQLDRRRASSASTSTPTTRVPAACGAARSARRRSCRSSRSPTGSSTLHQGAAPTGGDDLWYLTALDFRTGGRSTSSSRARGSGFNNNYAPVTLGPDGSAYVGVLGGLTRFADAVPPPGAAASGRTSGGRRCLARRRAGARAGSRASPRPAARAGRRALRRDRPPRGAALRDRRRHRPRGVRRPRPGPPRRLDRARAHRAGGPPRQLAPRLPARVPLGDAASAGRPYGAAAATSSRSAAAASAGSGSLPNARAPAPSARACAAPRLGVR